jgi:hypothetical protein
MNSLFGIIVSFPYVFFKAHKMESIVTNLSRNDKYKNKELSKTGYNYL